MSLRRREYLGEGIQHRELFGGQDVAVMYHKNTIATLEGYVKRDRPTGLLKRSYDYAIQAHKKALHMFETLGQGKKTITKDIRAAKRARKGALLLTRQIEFVK